MGLRRTLGLGYINPLHHNQLFYSSHEGFVVHELLCDEVNRIGF